MFPFRSSFPICVALALATVMPLQAQAGSGPVPLDPADFATHPDDQVELGRLLFFDPVLSGNKDVACATCHHPDLGTSDGLSLGLGDGGTMMGVARMPTQGDNRPEERIGRNAPALFNLGHADIRVLFHDGRLERDETRKAGFRTPLDDDMVTGFSGIVSAQSMFPVLSSDEMAGHYSENGIAQKVRKGEITGPDGAWDRIARRVAAIPAYGEAFVAAFDHITAPDDIAFTDVSNVVAAFMEAAFRADASAYDRWLAGDEAALTDAQDRGRQLFFGKAGCSACHSGALLTDQSFHAIAMPQIGPGRSGRFESHHEDHGRLRVTGKADDIYKFRTPALRNVALTAPYGHAGAYATLEAVIDHHLDPVAALYAYDRAQAVLPDFAEAAASDFDVLDNPDLVAQIAAANTLAPLALDAAERADLVAFMHALTDETFRTRFDVPDTVPSGLDVPRVTRPGN